MLEGLEISILNNHELERTLRIDSDFYSKVNLQIDKRLKALNACSLTNYAIISDGNHMSISDSFTEMGVPYYRGGDIYNMFIEQCPSPLYIPRSVFNMKTMLRSHLKKGDILMSIVGAIIGNLSLVSTDNDATCSCKLAIIRPFANLSPEYIMTFLKSQMGQSQIQRYRRGSGQTGFILEDFDQLLIPELNDKINLFLKDLLNKAKQSFVIGVEKYNKAITLLHEQLLLQKMYLNTSNIKIQSNKNSFLNSGRLDAEYYQPLYEDYAKLTISYHNSAKKIGSICDIKDNNYTPKSKREYKYIELSNIGKYGNIDGYTKYEGWELPTRARRIVASGDVIVSSIEGSLDSCALVTEEYNEALCSTGFYVVRSSFFNPETLLVLFKSKPIQMLMKKGCSGTILTAISKNELEKIPLPLITEDIQEEIAQYVQDSFKLRRESKHLLNIAKQSVEIAISKNEEIALKFLKDNGESL